MNTGQANKITKFNLNWIALHKNYFKCFFTNPESDEIIKRDYKNLLH